MRTSSRIPLPVPPEVEVEVDLDLNGGSGKDTVADRVHCFSVEEINAINSAIAAGRPLLVRGEPGIGKSQMALAAAKMLDRPYLHQAVDSQTESRDLLWRFDAVRRLGDAQLLSVAKEKGSIDLAETNYLVPGPLWWAFNWESAKAHVVATLNLPMPFARGNGNPDHGVVVLIDEIDKAEPELANGLLEALGARQFSPLSGPPIKLAGPPPLIVITSNEERSLSQAFVRRCLVLNMALPTDDTLLSALLVRRGKAHFKTRVTDTVLLTGAQYLIEDRRDAMRAGIRPYPGQAEYLDLLRAVVELSAETGHVVPVGDQPGQELAIDERRQLDLIDIVRPYTLQKHVGLDQVS